MEKSPAATFLQTLGGLWSALVLLTLIASAFLQGPRDFIASQSLVSYLIYLYVALIPGIVMMWAGERMK